MYIEGVLRIQFAAKLAFLVDILDRRSGLHILGHDAVWRGERVAATDNIFGESQREKLKNGKDVSVKRSCRMDLVVPSSGSVNGVRADGNFRDLGTKGNRLEYTRGRSTKAEGAEVREDCQLISQYT